MSKFTDTFTRTAGSTIGSSYTELSSSSAASWKTTGTTAESLSTNTNLALLSAGLGPTIADQYIAVTLTNAVGASAGVTARCTATAIADQTAYRFRATQTGIGLVKVVSGTATVVATVDRARAAGDRLALLVTGDGSAEKPVTLVGYLAGAEVLRYVDTSNPITAVGRTGLINATTAGVGYDDLATGDYTTADATGVPGLPAPTKPAPGKVGGVAVSGPTESTLNVSWTADTNADSYTVTATPTGGGSAVTKSVTGQTSSSTTLTGLAAATTYSVTVTAVNTTATGTPSDAASATTAAPPSTPPATPGALTVGTATLTTIDLSWAAVATASSYTLEFRPVGSTTWTQVSGVTGTTGTLSGLTAGTSYEVRHYAVNGAGASPASSTITAATVAAPVSGTNPVNADGVPKWRGLIFNLAGERIVAAGGVLHRLHAEFLGLVAGYTLPDWLTVPGGAASMSSTLGRVLKLTTAGAAGSKATLQLAVPLQTTEVGAVLIELRHMAFSAASPAADWRLFFTDGANVGATALQLAGTDTLVLASQGETNTTKTPQAVLGEHAARRRHTGLLVSTATKEVWLLQEDSVIGYRDCSAAWTDGLANLGVSITAQSSTAAELRMASLTVTIYARDTA